MRGRRREREDPYSVKNFWRSLARSISRIKRGIHLTPDDIVFRDKFRLIETMRTPPAGLKYRDAHVVIYPVPGVPQQYTSTFNGYTYTAASVLDLFDQLTERESK